MERPLTVTDAADFYKSNTGNEVRYYPAIPSNQIIAKTASDTGDIMTVRGHGVYDGTVSRLYAVAVYGSRQEAEAHKAAEAPKAPQNTVEQVSDDLDPDLPPISAEAGAKPIPNKDHSRARPTSKRAKRGDD